MPSIQRYGTTWNADDPAMVEMSLIQSGGYCTFKGKKYGNGLLFHYLALRTLLWPKRWFHKWVKLTYEEILKNQMTVLLGSASCGKSSIGAEYCLLDYWCFPNNTLVICSTTTREKLESAIFGEIKLLFNTARESRPWLAGNLIDHRQAIVTDDIEGDDARDMRKAIQGKACFVGRNYVGLGTTAGIKQERIRFFADEVQFMPGSFLDCLPNMFSNPDVKVIASGNPRHDPDDQLGIAAEPKDGWNSVAEIDKTTVWDTKFLDSRCINFIGTDSPNFDVPEDQPEPFPRLIGRRFARKIAHDYGENSPEYETQVKGRMRLALAHARVITREICKQHHAHDALVWDGVEKTKIKAIDPAYGGGDRCVSMDLEFGKCADGKVRIRVASYKTIKINLKDPRTPEDQIADAVFQDAQEEGIPAKNIGYDSFGKGTVGFAFARKFGADSPIPIDSGGKTTDRPVRQGLFVYDNKTGANRLKKCSEHYSKFVTEMWFSVRYAIEADQMRELPVEVMLEGCAREYETVAGDKIEIEPKSQMREKGRSPDNMDCLSIGVEMARRRGFQIESLGPTTEVNANDQSWLDEEALEYQDLIKSGLLKHA